jgi:hypothetical protein
LKISYEDYYKNPAEETKRKRAVLRMKNKEDVEKKRV